MAEEKNIEISQTQWNEMQEKLRMLEEVADKSRLLNYQLKQAPTKKPITVKISVFQDKYIVGWKTLKFELGRNPATGRAIWGGEQAEYEVDLVDKEGEYTKEVLTGYNAFSDARYEKRIECPVVSKKETASGEMLFEVSLPGGKSVEMQDKFIN